MEKKYLAFDLGAGSGRSISGTLSGNKLRIEELTRFQNEMIVVSGHYHWNIYRLFDELKAGLRNFLQKENTHPCSMAVDTWGVDYGLLLEDGTLAGLPYAYRDARTDGMMEAFFKLIPRSEVYKMTGIQFMQLNTLFQLFAAQKMHSSGLKHASGLLFIPDLLNYLFTGIQKTESTFASTSQLFNPVTKSWEARLFKALEIPIEIMPEIITPGTILGSVSDNIASEFGIKKFPVVSVASHDTGSAVAAVPATGKNWAYLSSGTWSLMGIETPQPIINEKSLSYNFTNEGGVDGTTRFLKNITGMWLLQQCKKSWSVHNEISYEDLIQAGKEVTPFKYLVDTDAHQLMNPPDMPAAIADFCRKTNQPIPDNMAETVRCIFDSLAMKYKFVLGQLVELSPFPIEQLHIIGGGAKNDYLNQLIADAIGIPVIAGPYEATAIGNILMQARAMGDIKDLQEMRSIIKNSFESRTFLPDNTQNWDRAFGKYLEIVNG